MGYKSKEKKMKHFVFMSENDFKFKGIPTISEWSNLHVWYNKLKSLKCHTVAINATPSFPLYCTA